MRKIKKLEEGFYKDVYHPGSLIEIGKKEEIAHTGSLFYIFQQNGNWMKELYNKPGNPIIIYSPGESSPETLKHILEDYRLLSKDEIMSNIEEFRKRLQEQKEQMETDLESLRQQEIFVKSKI